MSEDRQLDVLRLYGELVSEREDWGGALVLACGEGADAVGPAVSIAGGTTLLVSEDAASVKAAMRRGELDFVVNTLDESLRVLKNQIRQRKAVSVGLVMNLNAAFAEMGERGVVPELFLKGPLQSEELAQSHLKLLEDLGMKFRYLLLGADPERWQRSMMILHRKRYYIWNVAVDSLQELRLADDRLIESLPVDDLARRRWLQRISSYIRDKADVGRWVWLSEDEIELMGDLRITAESR